MNNYHLEYLKQAMAEQPDPPCDACCFMHQRANPDAVGDGMPQQGIHRIFVHCIRGQIAILRIPLQESLPFEETAHAVRDPMGQFCEFGTARRSDPTKPG